MIKTTLKFTLLWILCFSAYFSHAQTTVNKNGNAWQLSVDGEPFPIKGVTFGYDDNPQTYETHFVELKSMGVNTIRTWGTDENTLKLLDAANAHGIKVMLGIWMRHGKPGAEADDSFDYLNDFNGMEAMRNGALEVVNKYKDHPAILTWGIGNEVYLNTETDEEKLAYSKLLESICSEIKKIDQEHPITSVEAWTFGVKWWQAHVPSIDIYGINTYGAGANVLPEELEKLKVDKPYVITEFGVRGEWEMENDKNVVKPEPSDFEKYETIVKGYNNWILPKVNCLGVYVFHYSDDNRFIGPWLLTHVNGKTRPQYWAIRKAYTGKEPINQVPTIQAFSLSDKKTKSNTWVPVTLEASDPEHEALKVSFYYNQRTGSRKRRDQLNLLESKGNLKDGFKIQLPEERGGIKVYAMVEDEYNNLGIATTSIYVINKKPKYLVPKADLPFYVYQDSQDVPYIPSAYMRNYSAMSVDLSYTEEVKHGKRAIKFRYSAQTDWYGLGFVDPPNDWGDILGGYNLEGAQILSFWAKSSVEGIKVELGFGIIDATKPYPDTSIKTKLIELTTEWKEYTISTEGLDLSCIRSGFVMYSNSFDKAHEIYLDDIVFK